MVPQSNLQTSGSLNDKLRKYQSRTLIPIILHHKTIKLCVDDNFFSNKLSKLPLTDRGGHDENHITIHLTRSVKINLTMTSLISVRHTSNYKLPILGLKMLQLATENHLFKKNNHESFRTGEIMHPTRWRYGAKLLEALLAHIQNEITRRGGVA